MKRAVVTLLGIGVLAVTAIVISHYVLGPAEDAAERRQGVLTGLTSPRLLDCLILEDADLPDGVPPPPVGRDVIYISVGVFYPGAIKEPDEGLYRLVEINGIKENTLDAVHVSKEETDEGFYVDAVFRTDSNFDQAELRRGGATVVKKVKLDGE